MSKQTFRKVCPVCGEGFEATNKAQVYCRMACRSKNQNNKQSANPEHWLNRDRVCGVCEKTFRIPPGSSPNRKYCSDECTLEAYRRSTNRFKSLNPEAMREYNKRRWEKYGTDSLLVRLYKKYPDLPRVCEAAGCGEGRVLEAAHKPAFRRNGAFRVMKYYERHMFWMLCPTCHKLVDRGICTPAELGLSE